MLNVLLHNVYHTLVLAENVPACPSAVAPIKHLLLYYHNTKVACLTITRPHIRPTTLFASQCDSLWLRGRERRQLQRHPVRRQSEPHTAHGLYNVRMQQSSVPARPSSPLTTTVTHENMVKRPPTPPSPEDSQFFTVVNPYPAQPYLTMEDSKTFARWIACIVGEENILSFHYKPKVSLL